MIQRYRVMSVRTTAPLLKRILGETLNEQSCQIIVITILTRIIVIMIFLFFFAILEQW